MLYEIARTHQATLLADERRIAHRTELEEIQKLNRLQQSVRVAKARLGLLPITAK